MAVAYSGGGDSTTLLHALRERVAYAVIVDHQLSEGSDTRTELAVSRAEAMGVEVVRLRWDDPRRKAQQAAARVARYSLMGEALRARGVGTLLTGHTLTDAVETRVMSDGLSVMLPVTYAPVWPGLRGVDVVRPMLGVKRGEVRGYLKREGLAWIDDPANEDDRFRRVQVRRGVKAADEIQMREDFDVLRDAVANEAHALLREVEGANMDAMGRVLLPLDASARLMQVALCCAAGASDFPPIAKVEALMGRGGTLSGAKAERGGLWKLSRDPGAVLGRDGVEAIGEVRVKAAEAVVWDGRFLVKAAVPGLTLDAVGGDGPKAVLPALRRGDEIVATPIMEGPGRFVALALPRLRRILEARARCG